MTTMVLDPFFTTFSSDCTAEERKAGFPVDVRESDRGYVLEAELPGYTKEEVSLGVEKDVLTIRAAHAQKKEESQETNHRYLFHERRSADRERAFTLKGIDTDGITAEFRNGLLTVFLPRESHVVKTIPIVSSAQGLNPDEAQKA